MTHNYPPLKDAFNYLSTRARPFDALSTEIGVRYDRQSYTGDANLSPRLHAGLDLGSRTTLRMSWGRYSQSPGIHELEVADGETEFANSELADQLAVGLDYRLDNGVNVRLEAYRRTISQPRPQYLNLDGELSIFPELEQDRVRIEPARSEAKGLELMVKREIGQRFAWSGSYALSLAQDEIDGSWVRRTLDQRHAINASLAYRPNANWRLSWTWQYHTGWPTTETTLELWRRPTTAAAAESGWGFAALNGSSLPEYHRLDVRIARIFPVGAGRITTYLDVFNLYNRRNLRTYGYQRNDQLVSRSPGTSLLPILPSMGLRWEF